MELQNINFTADNGEKISGRFPQGYTMRNGKLTYTKEDGKTTDIINQFIIVSAFCQNLEDNTHKTELFFYDLDRAEHRLIVNNSDIASRNKLIQLADKGIKVTERNASALLTYLERYKEENESTIPMKKTLSHLGWTNGHRHFLPYSATYFCDTTEQNKKLTKALTTAGSEKKSLDLIKDLIEHDKINHLLMVCALSSLLIKFFNVGCFIVHLQGESAETGKSTLYKAIASMFGNPNLYITRMDATAPAKRETISFLCNLPFILDEMELIPDFEKGKLIQSIYDLTEGQPKDIAQQNGNIKNNFKTWQTVIMTNGESDILPHNAKKGNLNRVLDIDLETDKSLLFSLDKGNVKDIASENYGHIAPAFIDLLKLELKVHGKKYKREFTKIQMLLNQTYTNRQSDIGALLIITDKIFINFLNIINGYQVTPLTSGMIERYLKTKEEVDTDTKALKSLADSITENINHFIDVDNEEEIPPHLKVYGLKDNMNIYIIPSIYDKFMNENGFYNNRKSLIKKLAKENMLSLPADKKSYQIAKRNPNLNKGVAKRVYAINIKALD